MRNAARTDASSVRIHPTAVVSPAAELGVGVEIGPHVVIESGARIGDRTRLIASSFVGARCTLGPDCEVHFGAVVGAEAQVRVPTWPDGELHIGPRSRIREHVTIHRATRPGEATVIGADNLLLAHCHVGHDCKIGDGTTIASGTLLAGEVTVGDGVFMSGNVAVHQRVRIGSLSMISGASRVLKDVLPFVVVVGNSEVCGLNVVGMRRAQMSAAQRLNAQRAYRVLYRSGLNVTQAVDRLREMPANAETAAWLAFIAGSTRGLCAARRRRRVSGLSSPAHNDQ